MHTNLYDEITSFAWDVVIDELQAVITHKINTQIPTGYIPGPYITTNNESAYTTGGYVTLDNNKGFPSTDYIITS